MGTLALDIETASPFKEPSKSDNSTDFYEWLSIAVAYTEDQKSEPELEVFFRQGGWDDQHTADLLHRFVDWCEVREIDRTLTYNGTWFDLRHMVNWAIALQESGVRPDAYSNLNNSTPHHVDLAKAAAETHEGELWDDQEVLPDFKAYQLEGIENESIWYDDYRFDQDYWNGLGITDKMVKGEHVGQILGERYVEGVVAGLDETQTHQELERLLYDYSISDIADLHRLYDSLGGNTIDDKFYYPLEGLI